MTDMNQVVLIGRLTRDAELKFTNAGYPIINMSLAVTNRVRKENAWQEEASFFDAVLFGKIAETLQQYLVKGKQVCVQGQLRQRRWEQEGQTRSKVEIVINEIQLLGGGRGAGPAPAYPAASAEESADSPARRTPAGEAAGDEFEDDIPF
jgi:single-strand DNA-binding protein